MNNYYTLRLLSEFIRYKISDKFIIRISSFRKGQINIYFDDNAPGNLLFAAHFPDTALFWDAFSKPPSKNMASLFPALYGKKVIGFGLVSAHDRLLKMNFENDSHELLFKPFSHRPNLFLIKDGIILEAFKENSRWAGRPEPKPFTPSLPSKVEPEGQKTGPASVQEAKRSSSDKTDLRSLILSYDKQLPRALLDEVIAACQLQSADSARIREVVSEMQRHMERPKKIYHTAGGHLALLPPDFLSVPPVKAFDDINEAVRNLFFNQSREKSFHPEKKTWLNKLSNRRKKIEKQIRDFHNEQELEEKATLYECYGNLLMSHPEAASKAKEEEISVNDWQQGGTEISVPVKKGKRLIDQAADYYKKSRSLRREASLMEEKRKKMKLRAEKIVNWLKDLEAINHPADFSKWLRKNESDFRDYGLAASGKSLQGRPYRLVQVGDYEVWIGKNAQSNDTMLSLAHKEDIWMHVRGSSGSHLILRNQGKITWPQASVIQRAASYAAAYSRQSGASLVPVIVAKRKHVRKPKGAPPGTVVVVKEQVETVAPQKPEMSDF